MTAPDPQSQVPHPDEDATSHESPRTDWAREADRIVDGVQRWLVEASKGAHGGLDTGAATCGVCPICRAVGAVRTADPAMLSAGLEVATSAALAVSDVLKRAADELMDLVTGASAAEPTTTPAEEASEPAPASETTVDPAESA